MAKGRGSGRSKGHGKGTPVLQGIEAPARPVWTGKHAWSCREGPRAAIISCGREMACWQHLRCVQALTGMSHTNALVLKVNPEVAHPKLRCRTGMDDDVVQFIMEQAGSAEMVLNVFKTVMPGSQSGSGAYCSKVALVSCKSGRHRSVAIAEMAADWRTHLIGPTIAVHMGQLSAAQCEERLSEIQQWLANEHSCCADPAQLPPLGWPRGLDLLNDCDRTLSFEANTAYWDSYQAAQGIACSWQDQFLQYPFYPTVYGGYTQVLPMHSSLSCDFC